MLPRIWKGSRWKLRLATLSVLSFLILGFLNKSLLVSEDGRIPYLRVPAYLIAERKSGLPLGTAIYADTKMEDSIALKRVGALVDNVDMTINPSTKLEDAKETGLSRTHIRAEDGDASQHTASRIFNVFIWDEVCGENLENLFNYPLFPYMPSRKRFSKTFKLINYGQNFALWLVGYFTPFCDGQHNFELEAKSGSSEVWISEDSKRTNVKLVLSNAVKEKIIMTRLKLTKRQKYYFEVFHKEGHQKSMFNIKVTISNVYCNRQGNILKFEPFMNPEQVWKVKTPAMNLDPEILVGLKKKAKSSQIKPQRTKRDDIFKIPFMDEADVMILLPSCKYDPSYKVSHHLEKYDGVWETHFSSIYPSDDTNITDLLSSGERQIIFGNDIMEERVAMKAVYGIMGMIKQKLPGKYELVSVLNVEQNIDSENGERYLVELELRNVKERKTVRLSEYVYLPAGSSSFCYPENFRWNKSAVVNVILTVGGQGRWAKYFVDSIEEVYKASKDENINLMIVDFNNQEVNLKYELERSSIPRFALLQRYGGFFKSEAIQQAANAILDPNSIILLMDLHLLIPHNFIDVVRKHCIKGKMAFNPILARLNCAANSVKPEGYWENVGYGIFATYKSDWDTFGGMNYNAFKDHWGGEDWEMLDRVLMSHYEVERLKVRQFFHVFHSKKGMWHNFGV